MLRRVVAVSACAVALAFVQSANAQGTATGRLGGMSSPWSWTFGAGVDSMHYSSSYRSTGAQAPRDASSNKTAAQLCGGVNGYWPFGHDSRDYNFRGINRSPSSFTYGGGINYCYNVGGKHDLFSEVIHPANGLVTATVEPRSRVEVFAGFHWSPGGPEETNPYGFMRVGPVFGENKISISSNQTGGGGRLETASKTGWNVGVMLELGVASQPLCQDCLFGKPLRLTGSVKGYWFGSGPSVTVPSTLGFSETAEIDKSQELIVTVGVSSKY